MIKYSLFFSIHKILIKALTQVYKFNTLKLILDLTVFFIILVIFLSQRFFYLV